MEGDRRVAVAVDFSPCSRKAIKWAVDNVVREGDHLILITVRPEGNYEEGEAQLWEATGSRTYTLLLFSNHHHIHNLVSVCRRATRMLVACTEICLIVVS